jgi:Holliday junction resolvase
MPINSRRKGAQAERELSAELRRLGFSGARRGQQFRGSPDSPDVAGVPGLHIESKRVQGLNLYAALEQAKRDAGPAAIPVVMHRRNHKPWVVIAQLVDMDAVARAWIEGRKGTHEA